MGTHVLDVCLDEKPQRISLALPAWICTSLKLQAAMDQRSVSDVAAEIMAAHKGHLMAVRDDATGMTEIVRRDA